MHLFYCINYSNFSLMIVRTCSTRISKCMVIKRVIDRKFFSLSSISLGIRGRVNPICRGVPYPLDQMSLQKGRSLVTVVMRNGRARTIMHRRHAL